MTDQPAAVISAANVLIDYISVERTLVLRLVSQHLFPIKVPRSILNEVDQLSQDQAEAHKSGSKNCDPIYLWKQTHSIGILYKYNGKME